jgi:hypothetical protein
MSYVNGCKWLAHAAAAEEEEEGAAEEVLVHGLPSNDSRAILTVNRRLRTTPSDLRPREVGLLTTISRSREPAEKASQTKKPAIDCS